MLLLHTDKDWCLHYRYLPCAWPSDGHLFDVFGYDLPRGVLRNSIPAHDIQRQQREASLLLCDIRGLIVHRGRHSHGLHFLEER